MRFNGAKNTREAEDIPIGSIQNRVKLKGHAVSLRLTIRRPGERRGLARRGELNFIGVEQKGSVDYGIQSRAARQFRFGPSRQQHAA